ncbi:MAG: hypothetical protein WCX71_01505 [Candidatus Buchananbacteria bacterium]
MDTIKLKFPYTNPDSSFFCDKVWGKEVWINKAWREKQKALGLYVPRFWVEPDFKFSEKFYFCLEFSAPKLINGNNIIEIKEGQFDQLVCGIKDFCKSIGDLGSLVYSIKIRHCQPSLIAIGKNINLTGFCSVNNTLKVLKPFDYKANTAQRLVDFSDFKHGGKEVIYSTRYETFKAYDKTREILNNAECQEEKAIADLMRQGKFEIDGNLASENLRIELTLKNSRKIKEKFDKYLNGLTPTLENIFKQDIWDKILRDQVDNIFNHPLQKIIILSLEKQPVIDNFLDNHYKHIQTKATIKQLIGDLKENGLAETRQKFLKGYKSRQTWYNYLERLTELQNHFDWQALGKLDNVKIHRHILLQFGITSIIQQELGLNFNTPVSKNIGTKQRNTV